MRSSALLILFLLPAWLRAQSGAPGTQLTQTTRDRIVLNGLNISPNSVLFGMAHEPGQLIGNGYVDTTFQAGTIRFYGRLNGLDSLAGVPVRLDMQANEVEIRAAPGDVRVAKGPTVKQFAQNNAQGGVSHYINVRQYRGEADVLTGFFEQLYVGSRIELLLHPYVVVQKGNFNMALNVGSRDDELIKKMDWYAAAKGRATKFPPNKKGVLTIMVDKKGQIETYLKVQKPDLKSPTDLVALFAYYNSLYP